MTEDTLAVIERDCDRITANLDTHPLVVRGVTSYIPLLLAEVRRLRAALVEERARAKYHDMGIEPDGPDRALAREALVAEGLLPRD